MGDIKKMNFKKTIFISILLLFLSVAAVSAADLDNNYVTESSNTGDSLVIGDSVIGSGEIQNSEILSESAGTFADLQKEINNAAPGSVLILNRSYCGAYGSRIQLNKDLTIDGQGNTLDCLKAGGCSVFYSNSGNIVLKNLKLINGHNDNTKNGGAIYITGSAQYTIENCTFDNNYAFKNGGAISNEVNKPLTIINSTFNSNEVDNNGGAIYSLGKLNIENSIFQFNVGEYWGGAIYSEDNVDVKNSLFEYNGVYNSSSVDNDGLGGGIYSENTVVISNSTFKDNWAANDGGAVYSSASITIIDSVLSGNVADVDGGAVYAEDDANVKHCLFESNRAEGVILSKCLGGAIRVEDTLKIYNSTFKDNYASYWGGAVFASSIFVNTDNGTFSSFFINNRAGDDNGGAIYSSGSITIIDSVLSGNKANVDGGAIYAVDNANVKHCLFESNRAEGARVVRCYGGAIRAEEHLTVYNSTFKNNYAENRGGALNANIVTLNPNCYFIDNTAREYGGAIYTNKFGKDIKYATFIGNKAQNDHGGAIYIATTNIITFSQCAFINNTCSDKGGAIYLYDSDSSLYLKKNFFINNKADEGQCVYNCGGYGEVSNNWWSRNPQTYNDELIEWEPLFIPNVHHTDSNPLKMDLSFSSEEGIQKAALYFLKSNGQLVSDELYDLNLIKFDSPNGNVSFSNKTVYPYGASTDFTIGSPADSVTISASIYGITVSKIWSNSTISAGDIVKIYKNDTQFDATFTDSNGDYLAEGTDVSFVINGVTYVRSIMNEVGMARLNINLAPGEYEILTINNLTNETVSNVVTVLSNFFNNNDLLKFYQNDSQYVVQVREADGSIATGGNVTFNINGVSYTRAVNETGHAKLNINLNPGKYIVTANYGDCYTSNEVTVKSLFESQLHSYDHGFYTIKLYDKQGNPYPNQKVDFNVNGVFYSDVTNVDGFASVKLDLMKGEYIVTSTFEDLSFSETIEVYT